MIKNRKLPPFFSYSFDDDTDLGIVVDFDCNRPREQLSFGLGHKGSSERLTHRALERLETLFLPILLSKALLPPVRSKSDGIYVDPQPARITRTDSSLLTICPAGWLDNPRNLRCQ